jgi:hypothetical protein
MATSALPLPPPLPALDADDVRAVVTAPTDVIDLARDDERWEHELGDQARLALLGRVVLEELTSELLFHVRPLPTAEEMVVRHALLLSAARYDDDDTQGPSQRPPVRRECKGVDGRLSCSRGRPCRGALDQHGGRRPLCRGLSLFCYGRQLLGDTTGSQQLRTIFEAYVGTLHARFGLDGTRQWFAELLYPYLFSQP